MALWAVASGAGMTSATIGVLPMAVLQHQLLLVSFGMIVVVMNSQHHD